MFTNFQALQKAATSRGVSWILLNIKPGGLFNDWYIPTFKKLTQNITFSQKALLPMFDRVLFDIAADFTTKTSFSHSSFPGNFVNFLR